MLFLEVANVSESGLFENATPDCKPIATMSSRFSSRENDNHKKRLSVIRQGSNIV